jgi:hypothetical protein
MSTTLNEVRSLLNDADFQVYSDGDSTILIPILCEMDYLEGMSSDVDCRNIFVNIDENGEIVRVTLPYVIKLDKASPPLKRRVMKKLMELNADYKFVKFSLSEDEMVSAEIYLLLEDGILTSGQLKRCVDCIIYVVMKDRWRLLKMLETRKWPEPERKTVDEEVSKLFEDSGLNEQD